MEKLDRKDRRFILICVAVIAAGALVTIPLFYRAFPEASIEFRVNRDQARASAEKFLSSRGRSVAGHRFAGRFGIDEEPKVYLERELGLERASRFYGREAKVWRWEMRWFRSAVKEEERVEITPLGDVAAFESVRRDEAPGPSPGEAQARPISQHFLTLRGLGPDLQAIEATPIVRPHRTDWRFIDEKKGFRMGEATVRYETIVSLGEVSAFREFVHVPESWQRDYRKLRSKNETANLVGNFALIVTFLAMFGVLLTKIVRKDVRWGLVGVFGLVAFFLSLLSLLNGLPLAIYEYDTASPLSAFLTKQTVGGFLGAVGVGAGIALVVAGAEPIYRERFRSQLSLSGIFSRRGLRTKGFLRGLLLGYALTAFFFAYQVVFYVVAARLGAWAPSDVKYDNMLSTAFPWVTVLFVGFLPAVLEEGSSRMFSISFLDKLGAGRFVAVVLPAFIWGFNHAAYPNQPFYIRGLEVGLAGCAIGCVMLRFGVWPLLVWHFSVDALYTALILLRSGNTYYVVSGAASSLILLLPLAASFALYLRRGGFEPEAGLTNGDEGFVPAPPEAAPTPEEVPPVRAVHRSLLIGSAVVALLLAASFLVPSTPSQPLVQDATGRRRAEEIAARFLQSDAIATRGFRSVTYGGTGFADDEQARGIRPDEIGKLPGFAEEDAVYVVRQAGVDGFERVTRDKLPLAFWVTRFFRPLQKEEWKILVDARRARVIGFLNPIEEDAGAPPAPSEPDARRRALEAAARLGYPAGSYSVIEVGAKDRPKRKDTTVVLQSGSTGLGEARPRLTAVFHGGRLAAFYPSIRVPEAFLREYQRQTFLQPIFVGGKIVAIGSFLGIAIVLFIRLVKSDGIRRRRLGPGLAVVGVFAAAFLANGAGAILRAYPSEFSMPLWVIVGGISLMLLWILTLCFALFGFVLFSGARPGWRRALRSKGTLGDALARAAIGTVGLMGLDRLGEILSERVPDLFDVDPALPAALERAVPALHVLGKSAIFTFLVAASASVIALAVRGTFLRTRAGRAVAVLAVLLALAPAGSHSAIDFLGDFALSALTVSWLAVCAFALLRDHAAAWVFFGVLASGVPAVVKLLSQPAPADRLAAATAALFLLLTAVALVAGRRREPAVGEASSSSVVA